MPAREHPVFEPPQNVNISIWRYMDFTKFVFMLENKGLFLSRADKLGDPFEGSYSKANKLLRPSVYKGRIPEQAIRQMGDFVKLTRQWTMINCWHMNEHESAGMWKLYTQTSEAIAIKSTYIDLHNVLDEKCFVGTVKYIDYDRDWLPESNAFYPYIHKRLSFAHERELRVIHQELPIKDQKFDFSNQPPAQGILKTVDISSLINSIYVAPTAASWYKELVERIVQKYDLNKPVIQSSLDEEPFF